MRAVPRWSVGGVVVQRCAVPPRAAAQDFMHGVAVFEDGAQLLVCFTPTVASCAVGDLLREFYNWLVSTLKSWTCHPALCALEVKPV